MTNLVKTNSSEITFSKDQVELIKSQIAVGCTDDELKLFIHVASKCGLDPFSRQIYAIKRKAKVDGKFVEKMAIQTGIDGFRLIAHRTGQCLSISDPEFKYEGKNLIPISATVTVEKIVGQYVGKFTATAYWADYYGDGRSYMANGKPRIMLGKCAESIALRKAFPVELSGVHTQEEMVIADTEEVKTVKEIEIIEKAKTHVKGNTKTKLDFIEQIKTLVEKYWSTLTEEQQIDLKANVLEVNHSSELIKFSEDEVADKLVAVNDFMEGL